MSSYTDALNRRVEASNWHRGNPQTITQAAGSPDEITTTAVVDDNGWVMSKTDAMNRTTAYTRDDMGRLTLIDPDFGSWSSTFIDYDFSGGGAVQTITKGGAKTTITYDSMFRPTKELSEDISGQTSWKSYVNTQYDGLGRVTFKTLPYAVDTLPPLADGIEYTFDGLGRILTETETASGGGTTSHSYFPNHRVRIVDPEGNHVNYYSRGYGGPGSKDYRTISESSGGRQTRIDQNIWGEVTVVRQGVTGNDVRQHFYYDDQRRLCRSRTAEGRDTLYEYDAAGQMTSYAKGMFAGTNCDAPSGQTKVSMAYDNLGRLKDTTFADNNTPAISRSYDDNGNVEAVYRGTGSAQVKWDYTYNDADMLTEEKLQLDGKSFALTYDYNDDGHMTQQTYPTTRPSNYTLDGLGRVLGLQGWGHTYASGGVYHANGTLKDMTYGNGYIYTKTFNARQLPSRIQSQDGTRIAIDNHYSYDKRGKITHIADWVYGGTNQSFTYDALGQLTTATGAWGTQTNSYDKLGNLLSRDFTGDNPRTITLSYDSKNRVNQSVDN